MKWTDYYFTYLEAVGEGRLEAPEGFHLTEQEPLRRAAQLQEQIAGVGIEAFVRACAQREGTTLPEDLFDHFDPADLFAAMEEAPAEEEADPSAPPQIDEPDGPRSAYEVLLDCCCLDEKLLKYLIDVLKRGAEEEFQKLALVTARKAFTQADFLYWFGTKEQRGDREELICVTLMEACFDRLAAQGEIELIAALISGDQTTFELFRCEAPELRQLPEATYEWYEKNYLQGYYPLRYMMKFNGISFPKGGAEL
ncbi:MAG: hypothetical protein IJA48_02795 [Oscillospiraceae bacterium]|nr:hypothetical protein [Oscillospiraceae bacterium]